MNLSQLKFIIPYRRTGKIRFSRSDFIFYGVITIFILLASLIFWDGYIFYQTLFEERGEAAVVSSFKEISEKEIDEVVDILDERQKKFKELLGK